MFSLEIHSSGPHWASLTEPSELICENWWFGFEMCLHSYSYKNMLIVGGTDLARKKFL